uniref:ATP synthase complex subunit 8 n=1 Tax=Chrysomelidae sp. SPH01 TaxID=1213606 RepID=A0A0S2MPY0_9CUCU|nr:ATP synthase F0 subunit 8 [Chrysomelidae sp. SPH01]
MPQMMPLNWLTLFFMFIIIFTLFNIINYYSFNYTNKFTSTEKKYFKYNWKW